MTGIVPGDLTVYLDAIDARLVADHDADLERSAGELKEVQRYAFSLLKDTMSPEKVHEDWPGFFRFVLAFVLAHGSLRLCHLQQESSLFEGWGDDPLTDYDRVFLETLVREVDEVVHEGRAGRRRALMPVELAHAELKTP